MGYATIGKDGRYTGTIYNDITPAVEQWHNDNGFLYHEVNALENIGTDDEPDYGSPTDQELHDAKVKLIENGIDTHIDNTAAAKGYGTNSMSPTAACVAYTGYDNPYRIEAEAFAVWKASIWPIVFQIQSDYEAGSRPEPAIDDIIAEIPEIVWP